MANEDIIKQWVIEKLSEEGYSLANGNLSKESTEKVFPSLYKAMIHASKKQNGVTDWIDCSANKSKYSKNSLSVNRNGSVGYTFYHPYKAYFSGDTRFLKLKDIKLTPELGLFLSTVLSQQKKQFSYGFKLGSERLKNLEINLPIDQNKKPDWQFMENYVKSLPNGDLL